MLVCIPDVLAASELDRIDRVVAAGAFVDGQLTAGFRAKRVKRNLQLKPSPKEAHLLKTVIVGALLRNQIVKAAAVPRRIKQPLIGRYEPDMEYGEHVDDAVMGGAEPIRSDVAVSLFLNQPDEYDGGELTIMTPFGERHVKLPRGHAVIYESSSIHRVEPVTRGLRMVAITWIQSMVRDGAKRQILFDLAVVRKHLAERAPDAPETHLMDRTLANLLRQWAEV